MPLCGYLSAAGAALVVSDLDGNRCAQAAATYGATLAAPEEIYAQHVDVFAPAALGAVLNDATISCLRCRIVCGGANNQLAEVRHDAALAVRGIVFVPDYLANAGGVIDFHQETIDDRPDAVLASVAHRRHYSRRLALRRRDRHHPVDHRGSHSPGADPAGQRRPGADPVNGARRMAAGDRWFESISLQRRVMRTFYPTSPSRRFQTAIREVERIPDRVHGSALGGARRFRCHCRLGIREEPRLFPRAVQRGVPNLRPPTHS